MEKMNIEQYWEIKKVLEKMSRVSELSLNELDIVLYIGVKGKSTCEELSRYFNRGGQNIHPRVGSLENKGLISKTINPKDARKKDLRLTNMGDRVYEQTVRFILL